MKLCPQCETGYADSHVTCPTHGVMLGEIRDLRPGMLIRNTYRVVRKLGQGGMGAVYLCEHTLMEERQALKFLSPELSRDEAFASRFRREVRTLRQVRHKNVVDAGNLEPAEDGTLFFSMEFVDGPDLRDFLNGTPKPLDVGLALAITRGIAEGLGAAHAQGMVHRDIKPENILMAWNGVGWTPKIADFGIVATKENSSLYTRTGGTMLTMAYAAPEQWRGVRAADLDGRTDLYALGGVLYEMLTGRTVFNAESYEGWAEEHRNIVPKPPSSLRPEVANWQGLDGLVLRLLAKDREQRPGDAAEVVGLLDAIRFVAPGAARVTEVERVKPLQRVPTEVERVTELKPAQTSKRPGGTSRRVALWSWVTASVVVLAVGFSIVRGYRNEQPGNVAHSTESQSQPDPPRPETQADPQQARTKPAHAPTSQAPRNVEAGTVWTDPATGLMWPKKDNGSDVDWQQAQSYCRNLRLAGHSDWRLARLDELKGIFDPNISTPGHCCKSHEPVTWHVKGNLQLTAGTWSSLGTARGGAFVYSLVLDQQAEYWQTDFKDLRALCVRRSGE